MSNKNDYGRNDRKHDRKCDEKKDDRKCEDKKDDRKDDRKNDERKYHDRKNDRKHDRNDDRKHHGKKDDRKKMKKDFHHHPHHPNVQQIHLLLHAHHLIQQNQTNAEVQKPKVQNAKALNVYQNMSNILKYMNCRKILCVL
jgi:hypothetical protein